LPDGRCGVFDHVAGVGNGVVYMAFVVVPCTGNESNSSDTADGSESGPNNYYSSAQWNSIFGNFLGNNNYYDAYGDGGYSGANGPNGGFINLPNDPNDYYLSITYPLIPPETDNNIIALNDITTNVRKPYKQKITELVNGLNDTQETGFEFKTNDFNNNIETIQPSSTSNGVDFPIPTVHTILRMHNHHTGLDPFFSDKDIIGMGEFFAVVDDLESPNAEEITSLLVTERGLFALRVDDPDKVVAFNDDMKNGTDENGMSLISKFKAEYKRYVIFTPQAICNGCQEEVFYDLVEQYLPTFLGIMDTGLTVYKGTDNGDGTYTWEKL